MKGIINRHMDREFVNCNIYKHDRVNIFLLAVRRFCPVWVFVCPVYYVYIRSRYCAACICDSHAQITYSSFWHGYKTRSLHDSNAELLWKRGGPAFLHRSTRSP